MLSEKTFRLLLIKPCLPDIKYKSELGKKTSYFSKTKTQKEETFIRLQNGYSKLENFFVIIVFRFKNCFIR